MIIPCLGFVAKPAPVDALVLYVPRLGRYVEHNPALDCWRLTADRRYATRFDSQTALDAALPRIYEDICDVWHVLATDFSVRVR